MYAIQKDVGEFEVELEITRDDLTLDEALLIYEYEHDVTIVLSDPQKLIDEKRMSSIGAKLEGFKGES